MLEPTPEMPNPVAGPSSGVPTGGPCSLEHLDNLCRLMEKLGELRDHNSKLQQRVQYLEDLKGLRGHAEAGTATAEEAIMKATEERFLGPASTSNARSFVKIGKRSGKFKPLQYSMSQTFAEEGCKRKESKWNKVKGALGWDRAPSAILKQTSPCSSAGQSPNVKRSAVKMAEEADPSVSGSSSSEELDPYFTLTDIGGDYDGATHSGLNQQNRTMEEGYRRSKSLEGEALFNHLRGVSTCPRQNRTPWGVVKGLIKTAKGHRHENSRLSFPSEAAETEGNPDHSSVNLQLPPPEEVTQNAPNAQIAVVPVENDAPSQESREDSNNGLYRTVSTGPRRPSKWTKVKKAFLSGPVGPSSPAASSPNSPNRHSSFVYDPDWDVSEEVSAIPRDEIRRSYLSLQQRLSQEFQRKRMDWERGGGVLSEGATVVENEEENSVPAPSFPIFGESTDRISLKKSSTSVSIADDQHFKNPSIHESRESSSPQPASRLAWQRLRKSRTVPAVPLTDTVTPPTNKATVNRDLPPGSESPVDGQERGLRWLQKELGRVEREKMRLERERDRFLRREAKQRRQEVLVRTSGGLFRFQGISHQFTRRLFEWERSQGIAPQDSTLALLHPNYADSAEASSKLARSRSEGVVGTRIPLDEDEEENDGLRKRILRYESDILNKRQPPSRLLRPKDFNSHLADRLMDINGELGASSTFQDREGSEESLATSREVPMGGLAKSQTRTKIRTRGKPFRQDAEDTFGSKQNQNHKEETQDQRQAAVLVSALSTQLLSLAQELEATLGSTTNNAPSMIGAPVCSMSPKSKPAGEDIAQLPSLLTNTVLQLRQGLKVLCKDHAEPKSLEHSSSANNIEKMQSSLLMDREENEDEDDREEDEGEDEDDEDEDNLPKRWSNKRKWRKSSRRSSATDPLSSPADVFVPTTRKIFSPMNHDPVRSVVTYVVDEPTKDSDKHSDSASSASSDQSERTCPPPVFAPAPITAASGQTPAIANTASLPTWKSPSMRNVCSIVAPAWLRNSGSRSQSSSPALRRRQTPPALPQSPGSTRRDKETAPSIRMMIAKYNQPPIIPVVEENGTASPPTTWKSPGIERRVRLQMERYEQGILHTQPPGCVQKSASAGAIRPPGILKSSSVGSIKPRAVPPPPAATAARIRTLRLQRAKHEFLSRTPQACAVPLIKSASASVIECSKRISESDSCYIGADASPKIGVSWRLRKTSLRPGEENSSSAQVASANGATPGTQVAKSCPSSPVMERTATDDKDAGAGRSNASSVGWMRFPGRIFRQK